jgi:multiple sugar transport system substrate-binding protein
MFQTRNFSRRRVLQGAGLLAGGLLLPGKAPAQGGAKRLSGVTLNVSTFSAPFPKLLIKWLPEFEELTGARVVFDTPSFPVYNQRADLELSTGGSAYDVVNVTFIYSSRWINAGWLIPLDDFIRDPNKTPSDWDVDDFLPGVRAPETGRDGKLYGIPWSVDTFIGGAARFDLFKDAGLAFPDTVDELFDTLKAVHGKDKVAGFVTDNHYGWSFVPFLQAFGGNVFRNPPDDLTPVLDTPEAVAAAEYFARIVKEFGPNGAISYTPDQVVKALQTGRVNYSAIGQTYLAQLGDSGSKVAGTSAFGLAPRGPAGRFPGVAVHGLGIPAASKNKEAAWAFIQWALSKQNTRRALVEENLASPTRRSDFEAPEFKTSSTINGYDIAGIVRDSIDISAKGGYMKYRTVPVYPQVDQQLNKAIANIASGQLSASQAMEQAQAGSIAELKRAGVAI